MKKHTLYGTKNTIKHISPIKGMVEFLVNIQVDNDTSDEFKQLKKLNNEKAPLVVKHLLD